jgi:glycogen synthase
VDVLVVTSLYPPHSYGGYEASCRDVVERWRARGHRVTVLTTSTRVAGVADDPAETGVRRELEFYWVDHALPERSWRERVRIERHNQDALRRAVDENRPDVVSFWSMGALSLGLLEATARRGLPAVLVVCEDWLVYGERADLWRRPLARSPRRRRLARALTGLPTGWPPPGADTRAVYVSDSVRSTAEREAAWRPDRSTVIGSGIDLSDFPLQDDAPRPWSWRLLVVGRLDPRKGVDVAVRALAQLPEQTVLDVVGRGDEGYRQQLDALVRELGLDHRVRFDAVPRAELASRYAAADALLFTPVWQEPFGLVPLEAMACGTPVVATGTGGSADFLDDEENCLLVPPGDPAALAAAVSRLADDEPLRQQLVTAGRSTAAAHSVDEYAARLEREHLDAAGER